MLAASYWSLLQPSIETSRERNYEWIWFPPSVGFLFGGFFVWACDKLLNQLGLDATPDSIVELYHKKTDNDFNFSSNVPFLQTSSFVSNEDIKIHWRRILLLVIAITVHNFPEGLAVGVAFGGADPENEVSYNASLNAARSLALGIGLQNFPEGLAVSLPLRRAGLSKMTSFFYGQLSGMVEPIAGILGAWLVSSVKPLIPYSLAFAAGAMIYVVVDDLVPESRANNNAKLATWGTMIGFIVMMILEIFFS